MALSLSNILNNLKQTSKDTSPTTVGIDVGSSAVKVVEIEETPKTIVLRTYGELQLGPYDNKSLGDISLLENDRQIEAVTDVMRESGVVGRSGALAIPLSSSFLTVISLPTTSDNDDISSRIPVEAKKYVPLPLTDVSLDWTELPALGQKTLNRDVFLAAIENKALANHKALLSSIGMKGETAEIEAFSLIRALWRNGDSTLAILDLGARSSKIYIVRNGILERIHRVTIGGKEISRIVSEKLNISFEEAENLKRRYDRNSEQGKVIFQTMASVIDGPLLEFGRVIGQYEARLGSKINRIVISGGVAASPYCVDYVKDRFGRPTEKADPFAKVAYPAFMEDVLHDIGPAFGVALGAALRKFQ